MNKICVNLTKFCLKNSFQCQPNRVFVRRARVWMKKGVTEPQYLDLLKPQIPYYPLINIQLKGYDFVVLEKFSKYLHNLSNKLGVNVVKTWCSPLSTFRYDVLKAESEVTDATVVLNVYERNLQIENISAKMTPILLDILFNTIPVGVSLYVHEHDVLAHEESRFIPDLQLSQFKADLKVAKGYLEEEFGEEEK